MALYSIVDLAGTNGQSNFTFSFSYLDEADIHVYIDGVETTAFTFTDTYTITLNTPLSGAHTVRIQRITPIAENSVTFTNGSVLGQADLNTESLQKLYADQEIQDQETNNLGTNASNQYDAGGKVISDVGAPVNATDAATKAYVDASYAGSPVGHALEAHNDTDPTIVHAKGDLLAWDSVLSKWTKLALGSDGQTLEADSTQSIGLAWKQGVRNIVTAAGDLLYASASGILARLAAGAKGALMVMNNTPLPSWLAVGSDGQVLVADSAQSQGVKWQDPATIPTVLSALYNDNAIMNPEMEVWQRGTSFVSPATNTPTADRWKWGFSGAAAVTVSRSTDVPTVAQAGKVLNYSLKVAVTTADNSISATDWAALFTSIEGYRWRHFAQRGLTLSFWVKSPKTGTHCIAISNSGTDRSFVAEYTVNASNTWEQKTITITASPSAGTWDYTTGVGAQLRFALSVGSNFQSTTGWTIGNFIGSANQVNCTDSNTNNFLVTGVKLEVGSQATPLAVASFLEQLRECKRYFQKSFDYADAPANASGADFQEFQVIKAGAVALLHGVRFPVEMRAVPSVTIYNPTNANSQANDTTAGDCSGTSAANAKSKGFILSTTGNSSGAIGNAIAFHWSADAEF